MASAVIREEQGQAVAVVTATEVPVQQALQQRGYHVDVGCTDETRWRRELGVSLDSTDDEASFLTSLGLKYDEQASERASRMEKCRIFQ
jgi:hypothetical protein